MPAKTYEEEEMSHLRRVMEASSDVTRAELDPAFSRKVGGVKKLRIELRARTLEAEKFITANEPEGP